MRGLSGLILCGLWLLLPGGSEARTATVRDLLQTVRLSDPHFSPDGKSVALVETRANVDLDEFESEIVLVDIASRQVRPLTRARHHAASPRWSPTGDRIGFLAPDADKLMQLYVMPMSGGDALQLTKGKEGVDQFSWSPDAMSIAYAMTDAKPWMSTSVGWIG
jgi:dipeptidyl aminopeptidase/acylaminoacyl peptidase